MSGTPDFKVSAIALRSALHLGYLERQLPAPMRTFDHPHKNGSKVP
jgi:hypothetical protein